jgi:hypothetical protein
MNTGLLIAIIIVALAALGGIGYGIWYAVTRGGSSGPSPMAYSVPPFGISSGPTAMGPSPQKQQQPPASFAQASR